MVIESGYFNLKLDSRGNPGFPPSLVPDIILTPMSRSRRKTPVTGIATAESEAEDKRLWHKRMRAMVRTQLHHETDPQPLHDNAAGNVWGMAKDGKRYWSPKKLRGWNFTVADIRKLMRK